MCSSSGHNEPLKFLSFMPLRVRSPLLLPPKFFYDFYPVWRMEKITKPFLLFIVTDSARASGEEKAASVSRIWTNMGIRQV